MRAFPLWFFLSSSSISDREKGYSCISTLIFSVVERVEPLRPLDNKYLRIGMRGLSHFHSQVRNRQLFAPLWHWSKVQALGRQSFCMNWPIWILLLSILIVELSLAILCAFHFSYFFGWKFSSVSMRLVSILRKYLVHIGYSLGSANYVDRLDQFWDCMKRSFDPTTQEAF